MDKNYLEIENEQLKKRIEALELVAAYAKDISDFWPQFTFRMVRLMCVKMQGLKEALELSNK